ncbi:hypothetical protein [Novosphingobium sp. P6W]|uniref:hypothetical protein n=1 Tax=Novosphingobium sp. P6W TaxID=1609758 RepID=UPI0005C30A0C|nr:hypothetical protein [Novosphingobium sp. P6W]AXB76254.1 hypothetical protein TQ38_006810 [Novosphingobium sp. P6W]KIS29867.1 hypothetical protein TQ38_25915 [Novosphingobium sp. P6W]
MTTRRALLAGAPTAVLATQSVFAPSALAAALGDAGGAGADTHALEQMMARTLAGELGDGGVARQLASHITEAGFRWEYPTFPVREADSVVAYAFGYRSATGKVDPNTGLSDGAEKPEPGPVNAMLADAVHAIAKVRPVRVYAQWEIAQVLAGKYGMKDVVPIHPAKGPGGKTIYLSTDGVAKAVVAHAGSAQALGKVAVVGHRDHVKRCVLVSRENGMAAAVAREVPLPVQYDPQSAQPWTRRRDAYLLTDLIAQLSMTRGRILSELAG